MLKYPYYSENQELDLKVIETIDGDLEYLANCKKFPDGFYYVKEKHLELSGDTWIKKVPKYYDYELKKEVARVDNLSHGVVAIDENGKITKGYFTKNPYTNCRLHNMPEGMGSDVRCMDYKILTEKYFVEHLGHGVYFWKPSLTTSDIKALMDKKNGRNNSNAAYNVMDNNSGFPKYKEIYEKSIFPIDKDLRTVSTYIKDLTFGLEMETINGCLPEHLCNQYGIIICKDGSTKNENGYYPPEYVTVPYGGAKGLQAARNVSKEIAKRSDIDVKCSLHVHIGGFDITRLFMISMFKLCYKIQDEIFKMFPLYKTNEVKYANKEKNYCKKLPDILTNYKSGDFGEYVNSTYEDIYSFLTGGKKFSGEFNMRSKNNPWGGHKWDIQTRYYWVNFVNPVFGKQDTIEFRLHTATLNSDKILNWLLICAAIIKFAQSHPEKCLGSKPITLQEVLEYYKNLKNTPYGAKLTQNLINYYNSRKEYFEAKTAKSDYIVPEEFKNDLTYSFPTTKIRSI